MQLLNEQSDNLVGKNKLALRSDLPQDCLKGGSSTAGERTGPEVAGQVKASPYTAAAA